MVEEIEDGKCKLLFLTNPQAELIASTPESIQKMLDALEIQKPSLVIEFIRSWGFRGSLKLWPPGDYQSKWCAGPSYDCPPFLTDEDEQEAEAKVDMFMSDVIIPLAAQTHAVVLCDAIPGNCLLSTSFLRMYAVMKAKWAGPSPFTVISTTSNFWNFYKNPAEGANWRNVRRASRAWRQRDAKCREVFGPPKQPQHKSDLDPNASCIILTDCIDPKRDKKDKKPMNALRQALIRYLSNSVPSLAIKTGFSGKYMLGDANDLALGKLSERAQAGTPVLALDVRNRLPLASAADTEVKLRRAAHIEEAKKQITEWRESLLEKKEGKVPLAETFNVCTLAYLHEVLTSDEDISAPGSKKDKRSAMVAVPLHEAVRRAQDEESTEVEGDGTLPPATQAQISELARWYTKCIFSDVWKLKEDREELEAQGKTLRHFYGGDSILAEEVHARTLLSSPNFFHANLSDMDSAQKLVNKIVRLDRLPPTNPLQGLLLLRSAWCDYDVAMLLAERYKWLCKAIFALQLLASWLVVVGSCAEAEKALDGDNLHAVFFVAVVFSILVSLEGMLNPKARWRQLRSSAMSLQSIIWRYRTRTGEFEVDESKRDFSASENTLCSVLNEWRDDLLAGASLKTTSLERQYPPHVYRHYQYRDGNTIPNDDLDHDDHQSPTQPARYIKLRIEPMIHFYILRVPKYANHGFVLKFVILFLGVTSSALARYDLLAWVTVATAAATAVTSWAEFSEDSRKVERYSSAINSLKKLLSWWDSLGEVEKASRENITHLVLETESIVSEEQRSWTSTASKQQDAAATDSHDDDTSSAAQSSGKQSLASVV